MNYFIEGLQGSGKSMLVDTLSGLKPGCRAVREGEYSPVELAWCAYLSEEQYRKILEKYAPIRDRIEALTYAEDDKRVVCYTKIRTDIPGFYPDLEQYEIYNGRVPFAEFRSILLRRYARWDGDNGIYECSLFQNTVEDMTLFRCASDAEVLALYTEIREALEGKEYKILYLASDDIRGNIDVIRRERAGGEGRESWFSMMLGFFDASPYAKKNGVSGEEALLAHFMHRQELELRICRELFPDRSVILPAKKYAKEEIARL